MRTKNRIWANSAGYEVFPGRGRERERGTTAQVVSVLGKFLFSVLSRRVRSTGVRADIEHYFS